MLIAFGAERIETSSWSSNYRGPLAIHAPKNLSLGGTKLCGEAPFRAALEAGGYQFCDAFKRNPFQLPLGVVVAVATVVDVQRIDASKVPGEPERSLGDDTSGDMRDGRLK